MTDRWPPKFLLIPAVLLFLATSILPLGWMLGKLIFGLVQNPDIAEKTLLTSRQMILLGRSLSVAGLSTGVALCLGIPVAAILASERLPLRRFCWLMTLMPLLIPPYILAGAWIHLLSPGGFVNRFIMPALGFSKGLSMFNMAGCVWCLGISFFPIVALIAATAIVNLDRSVLDIAKLNTNRWGVLRYAVLPQLLHPILASGCLVMIFALGRYGVPSLLGVNTYPVEIFAQFSAFYDENAAIETSIPLLVVVVGLILLQRCLMKNHHYVSMTPASDTNVPGRSGKGIYLLFGCFWLFLALTTLIPFASVISKIDNIQAFYRSILAALGDIKTTFTLALLTSVLSLMIAYPMALYLSSSRNNKKHLILDILCWIPIAVPGTILGLGLLGSSSVLGKLSIPDSLGITLLVSYIGMFCPFAIRILEAAFSQKDKNIDDLARMECQRWYQRVLYIDVALHSKSMIGAALIVFVFVTGELTATILLIPPGKSTLAVTIDNLLHYGANMKASVLCAFQAVLVAATILMLSCMQPKSKKSI